MKNLPFFVLLVALSWNGWAQEDILLKDYEPISIYQLPETMVKKAKYPVIDMHSHAYAKTTEDIENWVAVMDSVGIEKTIILSSATGRNFDSIYSMYSKYGDRFDIWCGIDLEGYDKKGWSKKAVKELKRCFKVGAKGVGEVTDKGNGLQNSLSEPALGMHFTDERMQAFLQKCGELGMPMNVHIAEPYWMYLPDDEHNDGLMNAKDWKIDTDTENIWLHAELISSLGTMVKNNPETTFIACHFANCGYDLSILGNLLDTYDNLYADIAARYSEVAPVPKRTRAFYEKYRDRLFYGTDMGYDGSMYRTTFRMLESGDEHFYVPELFSYHWPLHGLELSDDVLRKLYNENAKKIVNATE